MRRLLATAVLASAVACENHPAVPDATSRTPLHAISATPEDGNPHFFFLPPMVPAKTYNGLFDPSLSPTVTICKWNGEACQRDLTARFTLASDSGSDEVQLDAAQEHYGVNWHTRHSTMDDIGVYRINVEVRGYVLGFADVVVGAPEKGAGIARADEATRLKYGATLPIKFRIEVGAVPAYWGEYGVTAYRLRNDQFVPGSGQKGGTVNNRGQVAGRSNVGPYYQAAVFTPGKGVVTLGTLGGRVSAAHGINDLGHVAGASHTGGGPTSHETHAFLYSEGTMRDLGTLGGEHSYAFGLNNVGQVVGRSEMDFFQAGQIAQYAFLADQHSMRSLGTLGGPFGQANDLNDRGDVVGFANSAGRRSYRAFIWTGGQLVDLGTLGGLSSEATAVNNAAQVVGHSSTGEPRSSSSGSITHAFFYSNGSLEDLGTLGGDDSFATDLDETGQVVGYAMDPTGTLRATIWLHEQGDRRAVALDELVNTGSSSGWTLTRAVAISDNGRYILAQGSDGNGSIYDYVLLESNAVEAPNTDQVPSF